MYFIRLKNNQNAYIHPTVETKDELHYVVVEKLEGAAVFTEVNARNFINEVNPNELEMVGVDSVLK